VQLGIRVAVKRPLASFAVGDTAHARFRNEALYAARVRHPNVIRIHDYGTGDGMPYIAMELLEGSPLSAVLASSGVMPVQRAVELLLAVLSGVAAVHTSGITHRDLKPHNLFLSRGGNGHEDPVIIDFGVAKSIFDAEEAGDWGLTASGATLGTAAYMAPEQILCARDVGPPADQYSLAVTLYECLTCRTPFFGASPYETMHAALNARPHAPSELRPGIPATLDAVLLRALSRDPAERFPSAHAMGEALLPFASEDAVLAWQADFRRTRGSSQDRRVSGWESSTLHDRARSKPSSLRRNFVRLAATAMAAGALGASTMSIVGRRGAVAAAAAPSSTERPQATPAPPAPAPAMNCPVPASASAPPAERTTPQRHGPSDRRPPRGTNGVPILE
jgi:serine/threonine protein kinase